MNSEHLHRDLGRVEGEVKALRREVDAMNGKLDAVLARDNRRAGATAVSSGILSALVAFLTAWITR
jgi:hypothetical protein